MTGGRTGTGIDWGETPHTYLVSLSIGLNLAGREVLASTKPQHSAAVSACSERF
jgi:hypothetical protein